MATETKKTIQYPTKHGQRWDSVSQEAYGTPFEADRIIAANPNVPITPRLPGGILLEIPILERYQVKTDVNKLPPWKRNAST